MEPKQKKQRKAQQPRQTKQQKAQKDPTKPRNLIDYNPLPFEDLIAEELRLVLLTLTGGLKIDLKDVRPFFRLLSVAIQKYFLNCTHIQQQFLRICYSLAASKKFIYDYYLEFSKEDRLRSCTTKMIQRSKDIFKLVFDYFHQGSNHIVKSFLNDFDRIIEYFGKYPIELSPPKDDETLRFFEFPLEEFYCDLKKYDLLWKSKLSEWGHLGHLLYSEQIFQNVHNLSAPAMTFDVVENSEATVTVGERETRNDLGPKV